MHTSKAVSRALFALALVAVAAGCGGGGTTNPSPAPTATATGSGGNAAFPCGSVSGNATGTLSPVAGSAV